MLPLPNQVNLFLIAELAIVYTDVKNNMKVFFSWRFTMCKARRALSR